MISPPTSSVDVAPSLRKELCVRWHLCMADQPKEKGKGMASEEGSVSPNLEERLEKLNLQGEEEDDLDLW